MVILDYKSIICAGKTFVLHLQAMQEEVTLKALICLVDRKTGEKSKQRPRFIKQDQIAIVRFESEDVICMERFKDHPQLGRFTLRDEGEKTNDLLLVALCWILCVYRILTVALIFSQVKPSELAKCWNWWSRHSAHYVTRPGRRLVLVPAQTAPDPVIYIFSKKNHTVVSSVRPSPVLEVFAPQNFIKGVWNAVLDRAYQKQTNHGPGLQFIHPLLLYNIIIRATMIIVIRFRRQMPKENSVNCRLVLNETLPTILWISTSFLKIFHTEAEVEFSNKRIGQYLST